MGLRALLNVSKGQQNRLTPMQMRVKGAPRSMDDPKAKTGAIQATLPGVGQVLNFSQSVQGKGSRELRIVLKAKADGEGFPTEKLGILLALFIALGLIHLVGPKPE